MGGAALGGVIGRVEPKIKKYIGLGILSQAGVAIGLSLIVQADFAKLAARPDVAAALATFAEAHPAMQAILYHPLAISAAVITTITATCVIFEIIGPIGTRIALTRAGEVG